MKTVLASFAVVGLLAAGAGVYAAGGSTPAYQVKAIHAYLFFHETGRFDTRDLVAEKPALWNTPIGEGDAGEKSSAVLMVVELAGPAFNQDLKGALQVTAAEGNRVLLTRTIALGTFFSEKKSIQVPFLVYDTGCAPLSLEATVVLFTGKTHAKKVVVEFKCGE